MPRRRQRSPRGEVIDLAQARRRRRLDGYSGRIVRVLGANRAALGRLYASGALFTRAGARAGRNLLLAREHLLKVASLLDRLSDRGDIPAPRAPEQIDAIYVELDALLERTAVLTSRTGTYLARLRGE